MNGEDAREGGSLSRRSRYGMRRSCDACGRKKKRCDGEEPCSRCLRTESECRYSKRRWHHPNPPQHQHQCQIHQSGGEAVHASEDLVHLTPGGLVEGRMLPFKRCRLRASPATGLVGMQENAFLSDFFGCVGFLPLTNESQIRETMVKIMVSVYPHQELGFSSDFQEEGQYDALEVGGAPSNVWGVNQPPKDPSICTFWCAVAVGALAKGCPIESVERYTQLASEALEASRSSSTDTELAKASASLTYLHEFMGDADKFRESLELSESFLRASMRQGSNDMHMGLPELVQQLRKHGRKEGNIHDSLKESSWDGEQAPMQWDEVATEGDVYRFVAQSCRAFDRAVLAKAQEQGSHDLDGLYSSESDTSTSLRNEVLPQAMSEAIVAVLGNTGSLDFEPLKEAADRPSIRGGIGGLFTNGALILEKATKGELDATLDRLSRSIEVYERYPGLYRSMMGCHLTHMMLAILAEIRDSRARGMYDRLRKAQNCCCVSHSGASHMPIPPLDEWQGMGMICSDLRCRAIATLIKSEHMKTFTTACADSIHDTAGPLPTASGPGEQTPGEVSSTSLATEEVAYPSSAPPTKSWNGCNATSKFPQGQDPAGGNGCADVAAALVASPFSPSNQSDTGFDSDSSCAGVSTRELDVLSRAAGGDMYKHHPGIAVVEGEEIASSDWLEVTVAMLDGVHAL